MKIQILRLSFLLVVITSFYCTKKTESLPPMIVVFSSGQAEIIKNGKSAQAAVGTPVGASDLLKTENGVMELQSRKGTMIRVHPFTTVTVSKLYSADQDKSLLIVEQGGLLA